MVGSSPRFSLSAKKQLELKWRRRRRLRPRRRRRQQRRRRNVNKATSSFNWFDSFVIICSFDYAWIMIFSVSENARCIAYATKAINTYSFIFSRTTNFIQFKLIVFCLLFRYMVCNFSLHFIIFFLNNLNVTAVDIDCRFSLQRVSTGRVKQRCLWNAFGAITSDL